jgi:lariat debranching enzyme
MHVRFEATYPHEKSTTKFLALDKCLEGREFLEVCLYAPLLSYPSLNWDPFE